MLQLDRNFRSIMKNQIKSVCILRLSALGDCINAFGLANALHESNKDLDVHFVVDKRFSSLFVDDSGNSLISMETVDIKNLGVLKAGYQLYKNLKHTKFDALFNLQTSIKASILSLFIKARLKYGYDSQRRREGQLLFINRQVKSPDNPHVLAGFLAFAKQVGFENLQPSWNYKLSDNELDTAGKLINSKSKKIFAIAPASAKKAKNWTVDGYSKLANYAISKGFHVILLGSNSDYEKSLCDSINKNTNNKCVNLCGKTSLRILAAVISKASLVLSPDSAAMHLASSLKVPVIGLFAIHNPDRVGAWNYRDLEVSVYKQVATKELQGKTPGWRYRVHDENAMQQIQVDAVIDAFNNACEKYGI